MKATIKITYTCGCGFKTEELDEAVEHAEKRNHSLTVMGTITKPKPA